MINKLLLVRTAFVKANLLDQAGVSQFVSGEPIKILPILWSEEDKPSHYAYKFMNLSSDAYETLTTFANSTDGTVLLDLGSEDFSDVLRKHGLRVHPLS